MDRSMDISNVCFHVAECLDFVVALFSVLSPPVVMWEDTSQFSLSSLNL